MKWLLFIAVLRTRTASKSGTRLHKCNITCTRHSQQLPTQHPLTRIQTALYRHPYRMVFVRKAWNSKPLLDAYWWWEARCGVQSPTKSTSTMNQYAPHHLAPPYTPRTQTHAYAQHQQQPLKAQYSISSLACTLSIIGTEAFSSIDG